jgi:GDPmannose 4,6-dehydratase
MLKQALITGITGQDGTFLTKLLLEKGYQVYGVVRSSSNFENFKILGINERNITKINFDQIRGIIDDNFEIYNFAAQSGVAVSWEKPEETFEANLTMYVNLLEQVKHKKVKILQASSAEIFEPSKEPITETSVINPKNPYAISKYAAHKYGQVLRETNKMNITNAILFNHESELRGKDFLSKKICKHVAKVSKGSKEILEVGNLDAIRDWGFAGEYVEIMHKLLENSLYDDFIIATGSSNSVKSFIEIAYNYIGINLIWKGRGIDTQAYDSLNNELKLKINPQFFRPNDSKNLIGNSSKLQDSLGFKLNSNLQSVVKRMVGFEIENL